MFKQKGYVLSTNFEQDRFAYLLAFGSNLGSRESNIKQAYSLLNQEGIISKLSSIITTDPLKSEKYQTAGHEYYANSVCEFNTAYNPSELYKFIAKIEDHIGHSREGKWLPRKIDIDILFAVTIKGRETFAEGTPLLYKDASGLHIPHQEFWQRQFLIDLITNSLGIPLEVLIKHRYLLKK